MIVTLCSLKGGAGKTTMSVQLSYVIASSQAKVLLVDADPQGSASGWAAAQEDLSFPVVKRATETLHREVPGLVGKFDHIVIDTPPRVAEIARSGIVAADLVLIPVQPSSFDVWAASETVSVVQEAQKFKPQIKAAFVINRIIKGSKIGREIIEVMKGYPFPVLPAGLYQRVAFSESASGYSVLNDSESQAAQEVLVLSKSILKFMGCKKW